MHERGHGDNDVSRRLMNMGLMRDVVAVAGRSTGGFIEGGEDGARN